MIALHTSTTERQILLTRRQNEIEKHLGNSHFCESSSFMNYRRSATTYAIFTAIVFTFDIVRQQPNLVYYFINYSALVCLNKNSHLTSFFFFLFSYFFLSLSSIFFFFLHYFFFLSSFFLLTAHESTTSA